MIFSFVTSLILCGTMIVTPLNSAFAAASPEPVHFGQPVATVGGLQLVEIPKATKEQPIIPADETTTESKDDTTIMPLANGVARLIPMTLYVYPVVYFNGEAQIVDDSSVRFEIRPSSYYNFIRGTMSEQQQIAIGRTLSDANLTQIGWYMDTGYYLDTYRPLRFNYYEWTADGKSARKGQTAHNGNNVFRLISYFREHTPDSYLFGFTGDVQFIGYAGAPTSTISTELSVTFE